MNKIFQRLIAIGLTICVAAQVACSDQANVTNSPTATPTQSQSATTNNALNSPLAIPVPLSNLKGKLFFAMEIDGRSDVYQLSLANNAVAKLTDGAASYFAVVPSPDQKYLAFSASRQDPNISDVAVMNLETKEIKFLTDFGSVTQSPAWTPDGKRVMFHSNKTKDGKFSLYSISLDGTDLRELVFPSLVGSKFMPVFSMDGSRLIFVSDRSGTFEIMSANANGGDVQPLVNAAGRFDQFPAISPDGKQVAFVSNRVNENLSVFIADASATNSNVRGLLDFNDISTAPAFSPDSKYVAVSQKKKGAVWQISIVDSSSKLVADAPVVYEAVGRILSIAWVN